MEHLTNSSQELFQICVNKCRRFAGTLYLHLQGARRLSQEVSIFAASVFRAQEQVCTCTVKMNEEG
jgi:hypothetical protein